MRVAPRGLAGVGFVLGAVVAVAVVLSFTGPGMGEAWNGLVIGTLLYVISIPILVRQGIRENDKRLVWLLAFALALKLLGTVVRYYVSFEIYERADATAYHQWGVELSERFRTGDFTTGLRSLSSTNFIRFFTGVVYTIIGPTKIGGFLIYSWLAFWGLFFFYRAFVLAVPEARSRGYARLLFFFPSLVYWPSSIGKESWMIFALGIAALGASLMLSGKTWNGFAVIVLGLWLTGIVRPHVAGLVAVALAGSYLIRRSSKELRHLAPLAKGATLIVLVFVAVFLVGRTDRFLRGAGLDTSGGVTSVLGQVSERTSGGGSEFVPSVVESPGRLPIAVVTVLFRPFILEAHNAQALVAAAEVSFLLLLSIWRIPSIVAAVRSVRRRPYVAFALVYAGLFVVAFSSVANFGLLARERVQLLPLYLLLLSIPPRRKQEVAQRASP